MRMSSGTNLAAIFVVLMGMACVVLGMTEGEDPRYSRRNVTTDVCASTMPSIVRIDVEMTYGENEWAYTAKWQGSGIVINRGGLVLTNWHVADDTTEPTARDYKVTLWDLSVVKAVFLASDIDVDLALLQIVNPPKNLKSIIFSTWPMLGETCLVLGSPLGLTHSVSRGIVSGLDRTVSVKMSRWAFRGQERVLVTFGKMIYKGMVQTDSLVCPGNSGGALVDVNGRLLGVVNCGSSGGPAFAIPVSTIWGFLERVL